MTSPPPPPPSPHKPIHPIFQHLGSTPQFQTSDPTTLYQIRERIDTFITHSLWFSPLIETSKSLLAFLPGRFSTSNLSGEAIYTILSLVGQYNDQVLGKSTYNPYSIRDMGNVNNNIQQCQDRRVRYLNTGLHFFSIFEALLEQASTHLFTRINTDVYQSIEAGINERTSYLTSLILQKTTFDPLSNRLAFDSTGGTSAASASPTILQLQAQFKRFPHQFSSPGVAATTAHTSSPSPFHSSDPFGGGGGGGDGIPSPPSLAQSAFHALLNQCLSLDSIYRYFITLDSHWMMKLFQFKMYACALIEGIKFVVRMSILYLNHGQMNLPKTLQDSNLEQLQFKNLGEEKRYKRDQVDLHHYTQEIATWKRMQQVTPTTATLPSQQQQYPAVKDSRSSISPTKPSAPALASSFSSNLTTTPFTALKPAGDSPPALTAAAAPASQITTTITTQQQTRVANQPIEKVTDLSVVKNLKLLYLNRHRGVISHGQFAFNLIQTYFHHYHMFPDPAPAATTTTTTSISAAPLTHDQNDDLIPGTSSAPTAAPISPPNTFIDYVLALYSIKPISPTATTLSPNSNPSLTPPLLHSAPQVETAQQSSSTPAATVTTVSVDPFDTDSSIQTVGDVNPQTPTTHSSLLSSQQQQLLNANSSISTALPTKPSTQHILSEILYWLRPVIYTLSSALCNQPALSQLVLDTLLAQSKTVSHQQSQQQPPPSTHSSSSSWWTQLIISHELSSPSVLPTLLSLAIDFMALYLSPAWDSKQTLVDLLTKQQSEKQQFSLSQPPNSHNKNSEIKMTMMMSSSASSSPMIETHTTPHSPITAIILQRQHQQQLDLVQTQLATWQQRKSNYWLYIFRPPFLTLFILKPLSWLADKLGNIPLLGGFLQFAIALFKIFQHHYFYASGS